MRLFYSPGFARTIDLDHVQEISDLEYACDPSVKKKDKDGIAFDTKPSGRASFWVRMAFRTEIVSYEIRFETAEWYRESIKERSDKIVKELELFKRSYEDLYAAWKAADGTQPAFSIVRT